MNSYSIYKNMIDKLSGKNLAKIYNEFCEMIINDRKLSDYEIDSLIMELVHKKTFA